MDERIAENETLTGGEEQNLGISSDLIRGHINTIILRSLYDGDKYGYEIIDEIEKKSGGLYTIKQPTLYSALKRLESLAYVDSYYGDYSNGGRRKYFTLTDLGKKITEQNLSAWEYSRTIIDSLISDGNAHYDFSFITEQQKELVELKRALAVREEALQDEKKALNNLRNELQRERALLSTQSSSLSVQKDDFKELKEKVDAQNQQLQEKQRALSEKEGEIVAKELALAEKEREIENAKAQLLSMQAELEEKKAVILSLNSTLSSQQDTIARLKNDNEQKSTEFYNRELELRAQQAQIDAQKERLETEKQCLAQQETALIERETALNDESERANSESLALLEREREEWKNKMETLEVERNALRRENDSLEELKAQVAREREELNVMREALQTERAEIDRKTYEITSREYSLEEKLRSVNDKQTQTDASTEEIERLRDDLQARESELLRGNHKLQEELLILQQQQKELSARQSVYNQQQLDFIARKNALASQQFDFADKLSSYNAQVKLYNENLEKLESERTAFRAEEQRHEERVRVLELEKAELNEKKVALNQEKEKLEKQQKEMQERAATESETLQRQLNDLRERELELSRRENDLNNAVRDFRSRQYSAYTGNEYGYAYASSPYNTPYRSSAPYNETQTETNLNDLRERAQTEGIKLNTAGNMGNLAPAPRSFPPTDEHAIVSAKGCYNAGLTLFKSAFIVFCIVAFESLIVFFMKDFLGVNAIYPAVGFAVGFLAFIGFAIAYACGYKPRVRLRKHASYILTSAVVFVIAVIIVTMIAVYFKAQTSVPSQLLSFVVIPVIYLMNIMFFVAFYRLFSVRASKN